MAEPDDDGLDEMAAAIQAEAAEKAAATRGDSMALDELPGAGTSGGAGASINDPEAEEERTGADLEAVFDVPVKVQAILGKARMEVSHLLRLAPGAVIELDRRVGEAIDIYVNNRLVARGEVVMVEEHLGVTMTEIIKGER